MWTVKKPAKAKARAGVINDQVKSRYNTAPQWSVVATETFVYRDLREYIVANGETSFAGCKEIVTSEDDLRVTMGETPQSAIEKSIDRLDDICKEVIAKSPFIVIASANSDGELDISPKGDPAGFVQVLDDKHLAIPDRPGNRRADTFENLISNPHVAIIFMIPGRGETLRINGEARIVRDEPLRKSMAVKGQVPSFAIVVRVEEAFMHCPKCVVRSKLWEPEAWPDHSEMPSIQEAVIKHANLDMTVEEYKEQLVAEDRLKLY